MLLYPLLAQKLRDGTGRHDACDRSTLRCSEQGVRRVHDLFADDSRWFSGLCAPLVLDRRDELAGGSFERCAVA
jgi:hypothetical protein